MGFCSAAMYEHEGYGWTYTALIALFVLSSLLASGRAVFHTDLIVPPGRSWLAHFRYMASSIVFTVISATGYALVHFQIV
jgi:hypothetical protein